MQKRVIQVESTTPEKKRVIARRVTSRKQTPLDLDDILSITALCAKCEDFVRSASDKTKNSKESWLWRVLVIILILYNTSQMATNKNYVMYVNDDNENLDIYINDLTVFGPP